MSEMLDIEELRNNPTRLLGIVSQLSFDAKFERSLRASAEGEVNRLATENASLTRERDELKHKTRTPDRVENFVNSFTSVDAEGYQYMTRDDYRRFLSAIHEEQDLFSDQQCEEVR